MLVEKTPRSLRKNIPKKKKMKKKIVARKNIPLSIARMRIVKASAILPATALLIVSMLPFLHFMK
jgi:hypothetical protein